MTETTDVTTLRGDGSGRDAAGRVIVVLNPGAGSGLLRSELTDRGWQVRMADLSGGDLAGCVEGVTDLLAAPDSPARAVLLGYGEAGRAAMEIADRHPERVVAVVTVTSPRGEAAVTTTGSPQDETAVVTVDSRDAVVNGSSPAPVAAVDSPGVGRLRASDLSCPVLALNTADPRAVVSAAVSFLDGLHRPVDAPRTCPARLPALTPVLLNDPDVIGQLREAGPAHRLNAAGVATSWILTGHGATTTTLADSRLVADVAITPGFRLQSPDVTHRGEQDLITIEGREHARLRRLVGQYLTPRRVETLRPRMQRVVDDLLDGLPPGETVDLLRRFALPLPTVVLCELFGVPERDRGYIHEWLVERMRAVPPVAHDDVDDYLRALIEERKSRPSDDLLGWVVEAEGDRLSEDDLVAAARFLMVGGHRAPTTLLASGVAALLRDRDQWTRLVDDPGLLDGAVEELLRFVTPFPVGLARQATAPIEIGAARIPEGDLVAASLVAANRDPAVFTDPDVLDVGRAANPHLAFGHGHHYCLGAALARAQAQIAIGTLVRRFPAMDFAGDSRSLHYRQSRVRYLLELPVVLEPK
ncbi:cytochrome P450 [Streptosporangium becharense]|uniref:Cytochrome P450 n=1 Tax=Streptosporangium becharense TaxID=1816182 RepID=A0A7W9MH69_9ACTN|nr:cytochrome P450 [Streptosporangium becharense]MBB2914948.1 cytochrome P450 [Streptosporangium becharense]MBB5820241.1 cytochrome P450 [Streptosporangium becharense]